jgi:CRISPR-associated protein Csc2
MYLNSLKPAYFHAAIPELPMGKYAHIVVVRETNSFPLFQTDGELNTAYVKAGLKPEHQDTRARITMFKRKQTSAERLHGRELLRRYSLITSQEKKEEDALPYFCEYNSANFCKRCPDCIYYGFAIGSAGSERAKVLTDSAFSLTPFDVSHQSLTFNAPYENGTMSKGGETRSSIGEQDHVLPQVFFPSVITIKDPTEAEFIYVLNNVLRTRRYGAQTTRTGTVENHLVAAIFSNGEIFSNLKFSQMLYDLVGFDAENQERAQMGVPLEPSLVLTEAAKAVGLLLEQDGLVYQQIEGATLLTEMNALTRNEEQLQAVLAKAAQEATLYASTYGAFSGKGEKSKGGKSKAK